MTDPLRPPETDEYPVVYAARRKALRHRWATVPGVHSTPEQPYFERRCVRCQMFEGDVR